MWHAYTYTYTYVYFWNHRNYRNLQTERSFEWKFNYKLMNFYAIFLVCFHFLQLGVCKN